MESTNASLAISKENPTETSTLIEEASEVKYSATEIGLVSSLTNSIKKKF